MVNWILEELENDIFLVLGFWLLGFSKIFFFFCFFPMKITLAFI